MSRATEWFERGAETLDRYRMISPTTTRKTATMNGSNPTTIKKKRAQLTSRVERLERRVADLTEALQHEAKAVRDLTELVRDQQATIRAMSGGLFDLADKLLGTQPGGPLDSFGTRNIDPANVYSIAREQAERGQG